MTPRIRVLHCLHAVASGGVEQTRASLARRLSPDRFDNLMICGHATGGLLKVFARHGWPIHEIGHGRSILDPRWHSKAIRIARAYRPHIIHGAVYEGVALAAVAGQFCRGAKVIAEETSQGAGEGRRPGGHLLLRALCLASRRVVGVSPAVARYLRETLRIPPSKVRCIPNGVADPPPYDPAILTAARGRLGIDAEDMVIGSVGRLKDSHKRFSDLIRALPVIRRRFPKVKLLIVGDGPDRRMLSELTRAEGVASVVAFAGYQEDARPFYELMDVFALASAHEAFGLVLVEAMFAQLPVVATAVGGVPSVVLDPETGFLVSPLRPDQLAERISRLLAEPALRRQMGLRGQARAQRHFSEERYVRDVATLYEDVLS